MLYRANPAMFRNSPVQFVLLCFLCLFIIGLPLMLIWWLRCKSTELTITDNKVILRQGILRKDLNEVRHAHIRNVMMQQSFFQRISGTGWLGVSTSGQAGIEVGVNGIPSPARAKAIIDQFIQ